MQEPGGLRSRWQKVSILKPRNMRTCLDTQDQAGSYMGAVHLNFTISGAPVYTCIQK